MSTEINYKGKLTPMLARMESSINELKKRTGINNNGKKTPITKTMEFSVSMVNQISKTMQDLIERFEGKLQSARHELDTLSVKLDGKTHEFGLDENGNDLNVNMVNSDNEIPGLNKGLINRNKFTASRRGELVKTAPNLNSKKQQDEISEEVEALFLKAETKHGIARTSYELKRAASKILKGDILLFLKANLMSNYHILYEVLHFAGKKIAVLFLHAPMMKVYRKIIPQEIQFITLSQIQSLSEVDVLFVENCELFEDLSYMELMRMKFCLERAKCTKVLVSNLMTYRAFCVMREKIGVPFSGIALPGLKIENLGITATKDSNKSLALKHFLRSSSSMLKPDDKVLILTRTQSEANELYKFIAHGGDLTHFIKLSNIHFGPLSNPPLNTVFSLVIYFNIPKKLEQFYCHISMLYNNYYYRNYGQLTELPKIHFHVFVAQDDFALHRHSIFMKKVTRLQVNRLLKRLDDLYKESGGISSSKENNGEKPKILVKLNINQTGKFCDMSSSTVVRTLRRCRAERLIAVNQPYPTAFNVRVLNSTRENVMLKQILETSKKSSGVYRIQISEVAKNIAKTLAETGKILKGLQIEGWITLEVQEELIDVIFFGAVEPRMMEVSKKVYISMTKEFHLEKGLLEYMYAVFMFGATLGKNFFNAQNKKKLSYILKTYALAEEKKIPLIFEKNALDKLIAPMRGSKQEHEEITAVFYHLLRENKNIFLKNEVRMCKGEGRQVAGEYVTHSIVKTMCGKPPKKVSLFDLSIRNCNIEFAKMDFHILLRLAEKVLIHYVKNN